MALDDITIETEEQERKSNVVDINNLDAYPDLDKTDLDLEADAFEAVAPPKPGRYRLKLTLSDNSPQLKETTVGGVKKQYYSANLECTIISDDPKANGAKCFTTVSAMVGRGKSTSTMVTLIQKGGGQITNKVSNQKDVLRDFITYIKGDPEQWADLDWEVTYKDSDNDYKTIFSSYKEIPVDKATKEKQFRFNFTKKDGSKVQAYPRLRVIAWLGLTGEAKTKTGISSSGPSKSLASLSGDESVEDLEKMLK